jgi:hypothetical protein
MAVVGDIDCVKVFSTSCVKSTSGLSGIISAPASLRFTTATSGNPSAAQAAPEPPGWALTFPFGKLPPFIQSDNLVRPSAGPVRELADSMREGFAAHI